MTASGASALIPGVLASLCVGAIEESENNRMAPAARRGAGGGPGGLSPTEGLKAAPERMEAMDLGAVRHDLKNLLATLYHGCALISAKLAEGEHQEVQAYLDEMRSCVGKGRALVDRLR